MSGIFADAGELRRQAEIVAGLEAAGCRYVKIAEQGIMDSHGYIARLRLPAPEGEMGDKALEIHADARELHRLIVLLSAARP